jgi:phosphoribosyl 1,2-cyclic phosphodiesterase
MSISLQVLASGSKGNAALVCSAKTRLLVDAGLSGKELVRRMEQAGVGAKQLDGIVVTHEHQDHVRGIGVLSRRFDLPVFLSRGTLESLPREVGELAHVQLVRDGCGFQIGDLQIASFSITHDARDPIGMVINNGDCRLGICTDLGVATQLVRKKLEGCQGLLLEANHDPEMLINGPYPWHLKQRIRSRHGHLSNADSCALLKDLIHQGLQAVVLAHLSETNNRPELVMESLGELLCQEQWQQVRLDIGKQHAVSDFIELH